jgi:hypothetical protein
MYFAPRIIAPKPNFTSYALCVEVPAFALIVVRYVAADTIAKRLSLLYGRLLVVLQRSLSRQEAESQRSTSIFCAIIRHHLIAD